jgi:VanZ family protein
MRIARGLTYAWLLLSLVGLGLPGEALPEAPVIGTDKVAHVLIFAAGTAAALTGWLHRQTGVLVALVAYAALSEGWLAVLPTGREADVFDVVANVIGVLAGWAACRVVAWHRHTTD